MELTQADYDERAARIDAGTADDDDRRLVELYEREGFQRTDSDGNTPDGVAHKLEITGEAEVVKGEADKAKPVKATRRPRGNGTEGQTK